MIPPLALSVDMNRVWRELETLATWSEVEPPAVTRVVFTEQDLRARAYVKKLGVEAGLNVREDAIGNTFFRWDGSRRDLPAIATGSHIDAIPGAGRFDGTVGVLGGLEAIRALKSAGFQPVRPVDLILFTSEEPTRFGIGCLGSRVMSGAMSLENLRNLQDGTGQNLDAIRGGAGFSGPLESAVLGKGFYAGFVELHIEQGPLLEQENGSIGAVYGIAAPASLRITFEAEGGHAGTVLMPDRHDPLCGAAEVILAVESLARASGSHDSVGTVGVCRVAPGAINGIPSRVVMEVDLRDIDQEPRDRVFEQVQARTREIATRRGLIATLETLNLDPPARCGGAIVSAIGEAARDEGLPVRSMASRAYHDALFMARIAPTGMIFIPSQGGFSHRPEEYSSPEEIARGVAVLARTLARLANDVNDHA